MDIANFFLEMLFWGHTAEKPPMEKVTIGHENTGVVVGMGAKVEGFKIGDHVGCLGCSYACCKFQWLFKQHPRNMTVSYTRFKDECEGCQIHNLFCQTGRQRLHGFTTHGHFAEYSLVDYRNSMVLPTGMDLVSAAPLFCAGVTGALMCKDLPRSTD